jgi:hypothetical protein
MRATATVACALLASAVTLGGAAAEARAADVVIKHPRDHAPYNVELEPHLDFGFLHYHDDGFIKHDVTGNAEFGVGFENAATDVALQLVATPEPSSALALCTGFVLLLGLQRFRNHRAA